MDRIRLVIAVLLLLTAVLFMFNNIFALGAAFLAIASALVGEGKKSMSQLQKSFQASLFIAAIIVMGYTIFSDYVATC